MRLLKLKVESQAYTPKPKIPKPLKEKGWGVLHWVTNSDSIINQVLFKDQAQCRTKISSDCPAYLQKSVAIDSLKRDLRHSEENKQ